MEWDLKMPPWDLSELEQNAGEANLSSVLGSSGSSPRGQPVGLDCSVDLKLGGLGDFRVADKWKEERRVSTMVPQSPAAVAASSLKRPRVPSGGSQKVSCLVDGCRNDLSNCREYHRRHKVCEVHSKTPIVLVGGQEQRFCQQCSRFHLLVEFDEVKRSCRKRLDGHNRRRRKPQPDCINSGNLFSNHHEIRFTSYPQIFPTAPADTSWSPLIKSEEDALYSHHNPPSMHFIDKVQEPPPPPQHFGNPFNRSFKEGKQFSFLHDGDDMALCNRTAKTISSAAESSGSKIIFSNGLPPVLDSDCALSLLSSSNQTSGINIGHMVPVDRIPMGQPLPSGLQYSSSLDRYSRSQAASGNVSPTGFSCSGAENEHLSTVLVSDASEADLNCQNIFSVGDDGASDGASHSLHFSWQ